MTATRTATAPRRAPHHGSGSQSANSGSMTKSNGSSKTGSAIGNAIAIFAMLAVIGAVFAFFAGGKFPAVHDMLDKVTGKVTTGQTTGSGAGGTGTASSDPSTLVVAAQGSMNGYARDQFGQAWTDKVDVEGGGNGCDTRNDILQRDLTGITLSGKCTVLSGTLADPYTGRVISYKRGKSTSSAVQIDHIVALANAYVSGADKWDAEQRKRIANDPLNLIAADGPANMGKGAKNAAEWLPANTAYQCTYVKRQVQVKNKYHLTVTAQEKAVMVRFAGRC